MFDNDVIDVTKLTDARVALICARLQLRGGKRYLQKGFTTKGIAALYDSVLFGMRYYIVRHKRCIVFVENTGFWDSAGLFHALARAGVFDDPRTFNRFSLIVERALWQGSLSSDADVILAEVEEMLTKLGVMPLNKNILRRN
jgi:hypothetical protein